MSIYAENLEHQISNALAEASLPELGQNIIAGWWFYDDETINASKNGQMPVLDGDVGQSCHLECPTCFACTKATQTRSYVTHTVSRTKGLLTEGAVIGVKSFKIVGAGEPLLFFGLLEVLEHCQKLGITPVLFTSGDILGNDAIARKIHGLSALELTQRLYDLGASVIIKFLSLDPAVQTYLVGGKPADYVEKRDRGLINAIYVGFNQHSPTRLGVDCLLSKSNHLEAVDLFRFFHRFNIFCVLNTAMDCGLTDHRVWNTESITKKQAFEAALALYRYCLENEIPFDRRISSYFTAPACSQLIQGLFVGDDDTVKWCPGGPVLPMKYSAGNLAEIWRYHCQHLGQHYCCLAHDCVSRRGLYLYADFFQRIQKALKI